LSNQMQLYMHTIRYIQPLETLQLLSQAHSLSLVLTVHLHQVLVLYQQYNSIKDAMYVMVIKRVSVVYQDYSIEIIET